MDWINIESMTWTKLLRLMINDKWNWQDHIDLISKKAGQRIYFLCLFKLACKSPSDIIDVYVSIIRSVLEYACEVWHPGLTREQSNTLEHLQVRALNVAYSERNYSKALKKEDLSPWSREDQTVAKFISLISQSQVKNLIIYNQSKEFKL